MLLVKLQIAKLIFYFLKHPACYTWLRFQLPTISNTYLSKNKVNSMLLFQHHFKTIARKKTQYQPKTVPRSLMKRVVNVFKGITFPLKTIFSFTYTHTLNTHTCMDGWGLTPTCSVFKITKHFVHISSLYKLCTNVYAAFGLII